MGRQGDDGHVTVMPALGLEGHQLQESVDRKTA
jgi:hypothetical protein